VAGAVALLWSAVPTLVGNVGLSEEILIKGAAPVATSNCGASFTPVSPNNVYGYGRLDILAAVTMARQPVTLTVTLVNSINLPVAEKVVELVDERTRRIFSGVTDAAGQVGWNTAEEQLTPGSYTLRTQACAALFADAGSIQIAPGEAAGRTITSAAICQHLPWISRS